MTDDAKVKALLERVTTGLPVSVPPIDQMIGGGRELELRRRRRRQIVTGGIAVASVAVVALATALIGRPPDSEREPTDTAMPHPDMTNQEVYDWAKDLPRGDPAQVSYVVDYRIVVAGPQRIELESGTQVELEGVLPGGWLAQLGGTDDQGNWVNIKEGYLSTDGAFRAFNHQPPRGSPDSQVMDLAVSPDGTQVAYNGWIVDVATGDPVAEIPGRPWVIHAWTEHGLEYSDREEGCCTSYLWPPGTQRIQLTDIDTFTVDGLGETYGDQCTRYSRIGAGGSATPLLRLCRDSLSGVSQSGLMLTNHGRVFNQAGEVIAGLHLPVPEASIGPFDRGCCALWWEGDQLLVSVTHPREDYPFADGQLFVRCRLDASKQTGLTCERASDLVKDITWPYYQPVPAL